MDFRRNARVFRAWRVERLKNPGFGKVVSNRKDTRGNRKRGERVLFLKGEVEMVPAGPVEKITEPEAILVKAMAMEQDGITNSFGRSHSGDALQPTSEPPIGMS